MEEHKFSFIQYSLSYKVYTEKEMDVIGKAKKVVSDYVKDIINGHRLPIQHSE
jgi:hypothetical protein